MKKLKILKTDEVIYYEKLESGLDVYMYPNDKMQSFYLTYNVRFGSMDNLVHIDGQKKKASFPHGTAHFLEHQLFQNDDGSAFYEFSLLGSSVNAYTSYDVTCYEVISNTCFKENLETLFKFVNTPFFDEKSIQNEKKIIANEIKMYEDLPDAVSNFGLEYNLNINDDHKYTISGTIEDIKKIDNKTLYKAYETFYSHENSFLVLTGAFLPHEALGILKEIIKKYPGVKPKKITRIQKREPLKVFKKKEIYKMNIDMPKINIAFKIDKTPLSKIDTFTLSTYINAILDLKFSISSDFYEKVTDEHVIDGNIDYSVEIRDDYIKIGFKYSSDYITESVNLIKKAFLSKNITKSDVERIKKVYIASYLRTFNDVISIQESLASDILENNKINTEIIDIYNGMNLKQINEIDNTLDISNESIYIIEAE